MDIYIAIDKCEAHKFRTVARTIAERIEKEMLGTPKSIREYTEGKGNLCILFSNRIKYIEDFAKDKPNDIINVTDNLTSLHIVNALKYVKDIYYLKADINTLMDRLTTRVKFAGSNAKKK